MGRGQGDRAVSWGVTRSDFGRDHRGPGPTRGPSAGAAPHPLFSRDEVLWPSPRPVQLGAWRSQLWESRVPGSQPCGCRRLWAGRPGSCWDRSGPAEWSLKGSVLPHPPFPLGAPLPLWGCTCLPTAGTHTCLGPTGRHAGLGHQKAGSSHCPTAGWGFSKAAPAPAARLARSTGARTGAAAGREAGPEDGLRRRRRRGQPGREAW